MVPVLVLLGVALAVAGADQATKLAVGRRLVEGERRVVAPRVVLTWVANRRGGFVALPTPVAVGLAVACSVLAVVVAALPGAGLMASIGSGLVVGGIVGNVVDRVRRGFVVDLVSIGWWRVFNLADVALVVGAVVIAVAALAGPS